MRLTSVFRSLCGWWLVRRVAANANADWTTASTTCPAESWVPRERVPQEYTATTTASTSDILRPSVQLLIGVKTSVIHGAAMRRAIRETWANRSSLPANVRVVFLGCAPDLSPYNASEAARVRDAIAVERERYDGDLLVHELSSCRDAYDDLVNKVLAFFQWSAAAHDHQPDKSYLMVADDDIYLRVDALLALLEDPAVPARRFYGGQVWAVQFRRAMEPQRSPVTARYFLSYDHYAMNELPPFANGPHYVLSADVAHFVGQSRAFFRGVGGAPTTQDSVGTFDDVSVALWMLAMQIHPTHLQGMVNIRDAMCRNSFVSTADFSAEAIYRIHDNVKHRRPACQGFSYEAWIKPYTDPRIAQYHREKERHMEEWNLLKPMFRLRRASQHHDISVIVKLRREDSPAGAETSLDFAPAESSYFRFCEAATVRVARELSVLAGQVVFLCEQLRRVLLVQIEHSTRNTRGTRPVFALLVHNLGHMAPVPYLLVAVAANTRYALVVLENLLVQAYPGMELFIFDEATYGAAERDPDIVVFTTAGNASVQDTVQWFANKYSSRLVLLYPRELPTPSPLNERLLVITSSHLPPTSSSTPHMYLPLASAAFGCTANSSPLDLLQSYDAAAPRSSTFRLRQFCVDDYAPSQCDHPHRTYFFNLLNGFDSVDVAGACARRGRTVLRNDTLAQSITSRSPYHLSLKIQRFEHYKFTIAFEDAVNVPGHVGDAIVAAFLAGSIPIYYGHSPTVTQLFNPKAFIDCGTFSSLRVCAKHVLAVHSSPSLSEAMRREPPVANITAFFETFSWHPDVVAMVQHARAGHNNSSDSADASTMVEQFKMLIDRTS